MGFIDGPSAPKRIPGPPFLFQNFSSLNVSSEQVKFERKSIVSSISMEKRLSNYLNIVKFPTISVRWGCSSVVERALCMREVRGSKPRTSTFFF